jgi:hypothetical protein
MPRRTAGIQSPQAFPGRGQVATLVYSELTENKRKRRSSPRDSYRLYLVFACGALNSLSLRTNDRFYKSTAATRGGVIIDEQEIVERLEVES